ncbi:MAG: hypothetical protein EOO75_21200 [Myxococcales bacterium]|nr:MAG: hypothetical protein EOO75_21200 [Myxococcales bacterium]
MRTSLVGGALAVAACAPKSAALDEGTALVAQGKLAEGAARLESACAQAPAPEVCGPAERQASGARVALARQAIERGEYLAAERQLWLALALGDDAARAPARALLDGDEMTQGARFERAVTYLGEPAVFAEVEAVAATSSPAAARAKTWLAQRSAARLTGAVREACGPARRGSCSAAAAALAQAGVSGAGVDESRALAEAEQRRVHPLRREAESFLQVFAADAKKRQELTDCLGKARESSEGFTPAAASECRQSVLGDGDPTAAEARFTSRKTNENLWRKLLKNLDDPALTASLTERKSKAQSSGEVDRVEIPKPPAKKP